MKFTINHEQRLYVIPCGDGYTCLGFDYARERAVAVLAWLGQPATLADAPVGTRDAYERYRDIMAAGAAHAASTGTRCPVELTPELVGLEHKRVEVIDCHGERRRFIVGKSTGWMPCHLEIAKRNSIGGPAVWGTPFKAVRVLAA